MSNDAPTVMGDTGIIYVCAVCGDPVESEPCREHQPKAYRECIGKVAPDALDDLVQVIPNGDLTPHDGDDCPCGPTSAPVPREDGSIGWVVIHHSLDGREAR